MHAQLALAVPIQPEARAASSAVSSFFIFFYFFFLPLAFLGFRTTVRPAALVSTFLLPQFLALGLSSDVLSPLGSGSAEGLRLRGEQLGWQLPCWEIKTTSDAVPLRLCGFFK